MNDDDNLLDEIFHEARKCLKGKDSEEQVESPSQSWTAWENLNIIASDTWRSREDSFKFACRKIKTRALEIERRINKVTSDDILASIKFYVQSNEVKGVRSDENVSPDLGSSKKRVRFLLPQKQTIDKSTDDDYLDSLLHRFVEWFDPTRKKHIRRPEEENSKGPNAYWDAVRAVGQGRSETETTEYNNPFDPRLRFNGLGSQFQRSHPHQEEKDPGGNVLLWINKVSDVVDECLRKYNRYLQSLRQDSAISAECGDFKRAASPTGHDTRPCRLTGCEYGTCNRGLKDLSVEEEELLENIRSVRHFWNESPEVTGSKIPRRITSRKQNFLCQRRVPVVCQIKPSAWPTSSLFNKYTGISFKTEVPIKGILRKKDSVEVDNLESTHENEENSPHVWQQIAKEHIDEESLKHFQNATKERPGVKLMRPTSTDYGLDDSLSDTESCSQTGMTSSKPTSCVSYKPDSWAARVAQRVSLPKRSLTYAGATQATISLNADKQKSNSQSRVLSDNKHMESPQVDTVNTHSSPITVCCGSPKKKDSMGSHCDNNSPQCGANENPVDLGVRDRTELKFSNNNAHLPTTKGLNTEIRGPIYGVGKVVKLNPESTPFEIGDKVSCAALNRKAVYNAGKDNHNGCTETDRPSCEMNSTPNLAAKGIKTCSKVEPDTSSQTPFWYNSPKMKYAFITSVDARKGSSIALSDSTVYTGSGSTDELGYPSTSSDYQASTSTNHLPSSHPKTSADAVKNGQRTTVKDFVTSVKASVQHCSTFYRSHGAYGITATEIKHNRASHSATILSKTNKEPSTLNDTRSDNACGFTDHVPLESKEDTNSTVHHYHVPPLEEVRRRPPPGFEKTILETQIHLQPSSSRPLTANQWQIPGGLQYPAIGGETFSQPVYQQRVVHQFQRPMTQMVWHSRPAPANFMLTDAQGKAMAMGVPAWNRVDLQTRPPVLLHHAQILPGTIRTTSRQTHLYQTTSENFMTSQTYSNQMQVPPSQFQHPKSTDTINSDIRPAPGFERGDHFAGFLQTPPPPYQRSAVPTFLPPVQHPPPVIQDYSLFAPSQLKMQPPFPKHFNPNTNNNCDADLSDSVETDEDTTRRVPRREFRLIKISKAIRSNLIQLV